MDKPRHLKTKSHAIYEIDTEAEEAIKKFLRAEKSATELAKEFDMSPQGVINMVLNIVKQWVVEEKIKL